MGIQVQVDLKGLRGLQFTRGLNLFGFSSIGDQSKATLACPSSDMITIYPVNLNRDFAYIFSAYMLHIRTVKDFISYVIIIIDF